MVVALIYQFGLAWNQFGLWNHPWFADCCGLPELPRDCWNRHQKPQADHHIWKCSGNTDVLPAVQLHRAGKMVLELHRVHILKCLQPRRVSLVASWRPCTPVIFIEAQCQWDGSLHGLEQLGPSWSYGKSWSHLQAIWTHSTHSTLDRSSWMLPQGI